MWTRRNTLPITIEGLLLDLLPAAQNDNDDDYPPCKSPCPGCSPTASTGFDRDAGNNLCKTKKNTIIPTWVEANTLQGEIPSRYAVSGLKPHEMAVVGTYVDPRVLPGFQYRVRTLEEHSRELFDGRALTLVSIGLGYCRRLTFQPDTGQLNNNNNYFWSDSCPDGFALELAVVSSGDKFTVLDACHVTSGTLEIIHAQGAQKEDTSKQRKEKVVRVQTLCRIEWFESGEEQILPMNGTALATPWFRQPTRLVNVTLGLHARGYSLEPGTGERRTTVHGAKIGDIPISYTLIGLEQHEIPVIGTYVDPRIATGFHYRVRRLGTSSGRWLFDGKALKLQSIGAGYAKRLTFEPTKLNDSQNYLWSDSAHGDGFAFEIRGIFAGQQFRVSAGGEHIGEATVLRVDSPHTEESSALVPEGLQKRLQIEVTCHVHLRCCEHSAAVRVSGTAVLLRRTPNSTAELQLIEDVGMDSQLNLMFFHQNTSVAFYPM